MIFVFSICKLVLSQESKKPKDAGTLFKEMYEVMHGENPELDYIPTIEW